MNLTSWFAKQAVTTAFLELAAGTLGFVFANATYGVHRPHEPLYLRPGARRQERGAALPEGRCCSWQTAMLSVPITLLWFRVNIVLERFGQQ